ncbi:hypothetical protein WJX82_007915 [Trebouxia sp. C0006]
MAFLRGVVPESYQWCMPGLLLKEPHALLELALELVLVLLGRDDLGSCRQSVQNICHPISAGQAHDWKRVWVASNQHPGPCSPLSSERSLVTQWCFVLIIGYIQSCKITPDLEQLHPSTTTGQQDDTTVPALLSDVQASQIEAEHKQISKCSSSIQHGVLVSGKA